MHHVEKSHPDNEWCLLQRLIIILVMNAEGNSGIRTVLQ